MKFFISILSILLLSYVLYQAFVVVPLKQIEVEKANNEKNETSTSNKKSALLKEYEECKESSLIQSNLEWLRQCDLVTPLKENCKKIITEDYPWELHYLANRYPEEDDSSFSRQKFQEYRTFRTNFSDCNCETLPKNIADDTNNILVEGKVDCLKEFEVKSKVLL